MAALYPKKGFHHPYPLSYAPQVPQPKEPIITLMCPDKPSKNVFNQLIAVALVQRERPELVLHTNIQDLRGLERQLKVVQHPWLPRPEYHQLLASAQVNLAASLAETFSYQAAESLLLGTPCILTQAVPWFSGYDAHGWDAHSLSIVLQQALEPGSGLLRKQQDALEHYTKGFNPAELLRLCAVDSPHL